MKARLQYLIPLHEFQKEATQKKNKRKGELSGHLMKEEEEEWEGRKDRPETWPLCIMLYYKKKK